MAGKDSNNKKINSADRKDDKSKIEIDAEESVDEILSKYPEAERYLLENDIECMQCSEPFWGSLDELVSSKGKDTEDVIMGLSEFLVKNSSVNKRKGSNYDK